MGRSKIARDVVTPYIEVLRPIPAVAWIPLAILMWPTEESSIIYITFLGALFPIVLNTVHGVEQTPEVLVRAAQTLGASPMQIFWHVTMPAALPSIATGLAIGMGVSWFSLLGRRDHLRAVRHRLLHLERLFPDQISRHRGRHADDRHARHACRPWRCARSRSRCSPGRGSPDERSCRTRGAGCHPGRSRSIGRPLRAGDRQASSRIDPGLHGWLFRSCSMLC